MDQVDAKKWLELQEKDIKPARYKSKSIVYSDIFIGSELEFELSHYYVKLSPFKSSGKRVDYTQEYMPAFVCEVVADDIFHVGGGNFDIPKALDEVLTWLELDFQVGLDFESWEEYDGEWVKAPSMSGSFKVQTKYASLHKENVQYILSSYEKIKNIKSSRAKKCITIKDYLQEGLRLKNTSNKYSFLSFYKVVELVAMDLSAKKYCPTNNEIAKELVQYQLTAKGSQRAMIYYLLKSIENEFSLDKMIPLADVRNNIAHNDKALNYEELELCQKLSFWAAEKFIDIVAENKE